MGSLAFASKRVRITGGADLKRFFAQDEDLKWQGGSPSRPDAISSSVSFMSGENDRALFRVHELGHAACDS
jgi:hypothetical protein